MGRAALKRAMAEPNSMDVQYSTVPRLTELVTYAVESISLDFEHWEEEFVRGPSLYFVLVAGVRWGGYADPLGKYRWPVETCRIIEEDLDAFVEAARTVAFECDGAVVISADRTIQEGMVRIKSQGVPDRTDRNVEYADWMGTKHTSAAEISVHENVLAAVTLSEETGRMSVFADGGFDTCRREELGQRWRGGA
jgi:hypothetical protein